MTAVQVFAEAQIEAISAVLGDTHSGFTGSEIGQIFERCGIEDPLPGDTKRLRIAAALIARQKRDRAGNCVVLLIQTAMSPVRFVGDPNGFEVLRESLNRALSFSGLELAADGSMHHRTPATTLPEAVARTKRLRDEMHRRGVHADVLRFCHADLLEGDCFDAVFEATKGLAERIREMTGLNEDGAELVDKAFARGKSGLPIVAFNALRSESERSEQSGLGNLMKGIFGTFRNPAAHAPKIKWPVSEPDALDLLTTLSLIHRRLDRAVVLQQGGSP